MQRRRDRYRHLCQLMSGALLSAIVVLPLACAGSQGTLTAPRVQVTGLSLLEAGGETQRFSVSLLVENPNAVALPVEKLQFSLRLAGEGLLNGESMAPVAVPANGSETIRLEVESALVSSLSRLLALVQGPDNALPYEINGQLTLAQRFRNTFPFRFRGQVPLSQR